jgi:hypothetical protein
MNKPTRCDQWRHERVVGQNIKRTKFAPFISRLLPVTYLTLRVVGVFRVNAAVGWSQEHSMTTTQLKDEQKLEMQQLEETKQAEHDQEIKVVERRHQQASEELKEQAQQELDSKVQQLNEDLCQERQTLDRLHAAAVDELRQVHAQAMSATTDAAEQQADEARKASNHQKQQLAELQQAHADATVRLEDEHTQAVVTLQQEHHEALTELEQAKLTEYQEAMKRMEEKVFKKIGEWRQVKEAEHATAMSVLQREHDDAMVQLAEGKGLLARALALQKEEEQALAQLQHSQLQQKKLEHKLRGDLATVAEKLALTKAAAKEMEVTLTRDHAKALDLHKQEADAALVKAKAEVANDFAKQGKAKAAVDEEQTQVEEALAQKRAESEAAVVRHWKGRLDAQAKQHAVELKWTLDAKETELTNKMHGKLEQQAAHHTLTLQETKQDLEKTHAAEMEEAVMEAAENAIAAGLARRSEIVDVLGDKHSAEISAAVDAAVEKAVLEAVEHAVDSAEKTHQAQLAKQEQEHRRAMLECSVEHNKKLTAKHKEVTDEFTSQLHRQLCESAKQRQEALDELKACMMKEREELTSSHEQEMATKERGHQELLLAIESRVLEAQHAATERLQLTHANSKRQLQELEQQLAQKYGKQTAEEKAVLKQKQRAAFDTAMAKQEQDLQLKLESAVEEAVAGVERVHEEQERVHEAQIEEQEQHAQQRLQELEQEQEQHLEQQLRAQQEAHQAAQQGKQVVFDDAIAEQVEQRAQQEQQLELLESAFEEQEARQAKSEDSFKEAFDEAMEEHVNERDDLVAEAAMAIAAVEGERDAAKTKLAEVHFQMKRKVAEVQQIVIRHEKVSEYLGSAPDTVQIQCHKRTRLVLRF